MRSEPRSLYEEQAKPLPILPILSTSLHQLPSLEISLDINNTLALPEFTNFQEDTEESYLEMDCQIPELEEVTTILQLDEAELSEFNLYFGTPSF